MLDLKKIEKKDNNHNFKSLPNKFVAPTQPFFLLQIKKKLPKKVLDPLHKKGFFQQTKKNAGFFLYDWLKCSVDIKLGLGNKGHFKMWLAQGG